MKLAELLEADGKVGPSKDEWDAEFPPHGPVAYIYGLHDPRTGELRYIGKSTRPRERLRNEINEHSNTHRSHWIDELTSLGLEPVQAIIDAVPADTNWQSVERAYISGARVTGSRLTNGTDGGDGVTGLSQEARERMAAATRGRPLSPEHRAKLVAAMARRPPPSAKTRELMRTALVGRQFTDEWRAKIRHTLQKLTDDDVREIRRRLAIGERQTALAAEFGVNKGSISNIKRRVTYRDVQ